MVDGGGGGVYGLLGWPQSVLKAHSSFHGETKVPESVGAELLWFLA